MRDFLDTLPPDCALRRILDNDELPDLRFRLVATPKLVASLDLEKERWQFVSRWFHLGMINRTFRPLIVPVLFLLTIARQQVPSLDMATAFVSASPLCAGQTIEDIEARVYTAWTGYLRELDAGLWLAGQGAVVEKDLRLDVVGGVDWLVNGRPLGITSSKLYRGKKTRDGVTLLVANEGGKGVRLVSRQALSSFLLAECGKTVE